MHFCSVASSSVELVKFDMQKMENPDIGGVEYQQGTLFGVELREYIIYKYGHECQYCKGGSKDKILEIDHIHPKSKGGGNRPANLILSCHKCNQLKSNLTLAEWMSFIPRDLSLNKDYKKSLLENIPNVINSKLSKSFRDAAVVNAIRYKIGDILSSITDFKYHFSWLTKYNRKRLGYPKDHWIDAACLGMGDVYISPKITPLYVYCKGHSTRQMVKMNKFGFPKTLPKTSSAVFGFKTGDMVKAVVNKGKYIGTHFGRIAIRKTGTFSIRTRTQQFDVNHKYLKIIHKGDGYQYSYQEIKDLPKYVVSRTLERAKEIVLDLGGEIVNQESLGRDILVTVDYSYQ
jgi:Restriction endonuclease